MAGETTLTIVGRLTADPQLRYTPTGVATARFTVAATARVLDKTTGQWRDGDTLFVTCTAWQTLAENLAESLAKGARVVVTGRLRLDRWETPDGEKRQGLGLEVDDAGPSLRFAAATVGKQTTTTATTVDSGPAGPAGAGPGGEDAVAWPAVAS